MSTDITDLAFEEGGGTLEVILRQSVDTYAHLDADSVLSFKPEGVYVDYPPPDENGGYNRYLVPWSNIAAIRQTNTDGGA